MNSKKRNYVKKLYCAYVQRGLQLNIGVLRKLFILMRKVYICVYILKLDKKVHLFYIKTNFITSTGRAWQVFKARQACKNAAPGGYFGWS